MHTPTEMELVLLADVGVRFANVDGAVVVGGPVSFDTLLNAMLLTLCAKGEPNALPVCLFLCPINLKQR